MTKRKRAIKWLEAEGWTWVDDYPAAGRTVFIKQGRFKTVLKNGVVKEGKLPPQ